jgi:hypothetical protein
VPLNHEGESASIHATNPVSDKTAPVEYSCSRLADTDVFEAGKALFQTVRRQRKEGKGKREQKNEN